ncbi:hypothetical protein KY360_06945 [Candidatus Woesearchaeota archaeon]|nr:hypothetical protein [Candidatus Woesearchaeota archaeon]
MKRLTALLLGLVLVSSMVLAQQEAQDPRMRQAVQATGEGTPEPMLISAQTQTRLRAQSPEDLQQRIQQRQQVMAQEMQGMGMAEQKVYQNQNRVRLAVHSLLDMEDLVGGIGPQVREIARNFNNSVQATIRAEQRIERRSAMARFFAGGDEEAASEIEGRVNQNQERIQQLKQLREECDCGAEVKELMRAQVQNMEQEQTRLVGLAQREKGSKGLFGWLWK